MRKAVVISAAVLWFACAVSFIYWFMPRATESQTVAIVPETNHRTLTIPITIGDQAGTITVPYPYQVFKPVYQTRLREPSRDAQLRFACLSGVAFLLFLLFAIVIASYGRCLWFNKPAPKSLEIQLTATVTFLTGIFGGALAMPQAQPTPISLPTIPETAPYRFDETYPPGPLTPTPAPSAEPY